MVAYSVSYLQIDLKFFWGSVEMVALAVWFIPFENSEDLYKGLWR